MPKTSDWVIIATEGRTIDGRKITRSWIHDMASLYAKNEYTALIWPEHWRSSWGPFKGKNWGVVEALKAEELDDRLRLFARLTPNQYLLEANQEAQKLFTSIEPEPDYKGQGRCYLTGLAVTDSPASTGTTQLRFSRRPGEETTLDSDALEELHLAPCFNRRDRLFSALRTLLKADDEPNPHPPLPSEDQEPMNSEQFTQVMDSLRAVSEKQGELEAKLNTFVEQSAPEPAETTPAQDEPDNAVPGLTSEQFHQLTDTLERIAAKQSDLETQFNHLSQTAPDGQRPDESGGADGYLPV